MHIDILNPAMFNILQEFEQLGLIKIKPSKADDTKMTEQEFYDMIEQRLKMPSYPLTDEKRKEWFDV